MGAFGDRLWLGGYSRFLAGCVFAVARDCRKSACGALGEAIKGAILKKEKPKKKHVGQRKSFTSHILRLQRRV